MICQFLKEVKTPIVTVDLSIYPVFNSDCFSHTVLLLRYKWLRNIKSTKWIFCSPSSSLIMLLALKYINNNMFLPFWLVFACSSYIFTPDLSYYLLNVTLVAPYNWSLSFKILIRITNFYLESLILCNICAHF